MCTLLCDAIHADDGRLLQVCAEDLLVWSAYVVVHLQLLEGCKRACTSLGTELQAALCRVKG